MDEDWDNALEWLDQFMIGQASLQAMQFFLMFTLAQLGVLAKYDPEQADLMLQKFERDITDVEDAAENLSQVCKNIASNVRLNLLKET